MSDRRKQLSDAVEVLASFVHCVLVRRALETADPFPRLSPWLVINNALFDTAVIDWCKLFGSDNQDHQPTHWKNVFRDHDEFRAGLLHALGIPQASWLAYRESVKQYRDEAAAHLSTARRNIKTFPDYEIALKAAMFYFGRAREALATEFSDTSEPHIIEYVKLLAEEAEVFARLATKATADLAPTIQLRR